MRVIIGIRQLTSRGEKGFGENCHKIIEKDLRSNVFVIDFVEAIEYIFTS